MIHRKRAGAIEIGETIEWCGRWVEVVDRKYPVRSPRARRQVVILIIESPVIETREVSYYTDESVRIREEVRP